LPLADFQLPIGKRQSLSVTDRTIAIGNRKLKLDRAVGRITRRGIMLHQVRARASSAENSRDIAESSATPGSEPFEHGKIRTTFPAKEVRAFAENLSTLAGEQPDTVGGSSPADDRRTRGTDEQEFTGRPSVQKLFDEIAPLFVGRAAVTPASSRPSTSPRRWLVASSCCSSGPRSGADRQPPAEPPPSPRRATNADLYAPAR